MSEGGSMSHKRWPLVVLLVGVLAALALVAAACGDDEEETEVAPTAVESPEAEGGAAASTVNVSLIEWSVVPDTTSVAAGPVTFNATNDGVENHELVVIRSDLAPDALPVVEGKVDEEQVEVIGEIEEFASGTTESATFDLEPGSYALICNIVEEEEGEHESHYQRGMRTAFEVTD